MLHSQAFFTNLQQHEALVRHVKSSQIGVSVAEKSLEYLKAFAYGTVGSGFKSLHTFLLQTCKVIFAVVDKVSASVCIKDLTTCSTI